MGFGLITNTRLTAQFLRFTKRNVLYIEKKEKKISENETSCLNGIVISTDTTGRTKRSPFPRQDK